jgi:hypothetical protein
VVVVLVGIDIEAELLLKPARTFAGGGGFLVDWISGSSDISGV